MAELAERSEEVKEEPKKEEDAKELPKAFFLFMFVLFRCGGAFFVRTAFVPDEYWQSLEIAHKFVFGPWCHASFRPSCQPLVITGLWSWAVASLATRVHAGRHFA
ncbi:hypothetical protein V5799_027339 [Amblyomma americanum]|uniref:Mannosyltransferase n=1 Tax=Amblyomma americanum TaxID=6943 RepID=A0AAQ4DG02_AMBAM